MKPGDIVFVRGNSPISNIVTWVDGGPFSHVAVAVGNNQIIEAQYFTKVRIAEMSYKDYKVFPMNFSHEQQDKIIHKSIELVGRWYDYQQIAWYFLESIFEWNTKNIWNSKNNLICSELVDILLREVGIITHPGTLGDITPNELYHFLKMYFDEK